MIRPVISEGFPFTCAPRGRAAVVCVLETDNVVDVNEVTGFVGVKAYVSIWLITTIVEVFAIVAVCK